MALPGGAAGFTLTGGPYDDPAFQGMAGKLTLSAPVTHVATGERVRKTWDFSIDYNGQFSVGPLPWTDDPAFTPTGFTYSIEWQALAWKDTPGNLTFQVPRAAGSTVDFDTLVPALGGGQTIPLGVYSVNGKQGAVTLSASDVGADAAGAATAAQAAATVAAATDASSRVAAEVTRADGKYVATAGLDAATAPLVTGNGTTAGALRAGYVPKWKPSTAYTAGEPVVNPSGQTVTANATFTSGTTYSASNWTIVSGGGGTATGYDIVILAGQSNMSGRGTPFSTATDPVNSAIFQYKSKAPNANTIVAASEPLDMHDTPTGIGPGLQFARWYASRKLATGRNVLLVPVAHGGTPLSSTATPLGWRRGVAGNLYANMIAQTQGALAAAGAGSRVVALLWAQGETDGDNGITGSAYQTDLDALINGVRTDLGISDLPIVLGTMVPEYLSTGTRAQINVVHRDTPNRIARTDVAVGPSGANMGDGNHYNAAGQRTNGKTMYDAYERITQGLAPYSETPPAGGIAFGITTSAAAGVYSLRKVVSTYAGNAILVRRSSDSTTQAIGFTSGNLDTATLLTFAGAGDAFVVTWYDQSGNGKDVTQATAANQPKIVSAGALLTSANGKPIIRFDGVASMLACSASLGLYAAGSATAAQVVLAAQPSAQKRAWAESISSASSPQYGLVQPDGGNAGTYAYAFPVVSGQITATSVVPAPTHPAWNGAIHQMSSIDTGTTISEWIDATADMSAYAYTRTTGWTFNTFAIGGVSRSGSAANFAMDMCELVVWPVALSTTDRQTAEANQKAYYGTP